VRDDVGRAKPTCYDLPHEGFAFGKSEAADLEGAREVTMHWASHVPRPKPMPDGQDFRKINKLAAKSNIKNAKELAEMKRTSDVRLNPKGPMGPMPKVIPSDVIPSFAYGKKSRPSTPIAAVVGCHYGAEYEDSLADNYMRYAVERDMATSKHRVRLTKAASVRISDSRTRLLEPPPESKELFKLTKFKKVPSRLQLAPVGTMNKSSSLPNLRSASGGAGEILE